MLINNTQLAWQFYQQEKNCIHQRIFRYTQAILMVFIVTLSQTSNSIQQYLTQNIANLLGADVVLINNTAITNNQYSQLAGLSQDIVLTQVLATTLTHTDKWQRTKLKAVDNGYPLQGELKTAESPGGVDVVARSGPKLGEIWLDSRLLAGLSVQIGGTIILADYPFTVSRILTHEPDRLMEGHNVDMRAMVNVTDLNRLNVPHDLIQHRYLISAEPSQLTQILEWQKVNLPAAELYHKQGAHPLALFWQRTENFIGLASIILFFMAAIAIEQLSHVQMRKEQYASAIYMSLGASRMTGFHISVIKWLFRWLYLLPVVLLVSAFCHWLAIDWLAKTFSELNWQWDAVLAIQSILAISLIFLVFQLPIWFGLKQSSVAQLVNNSHQKVSYWLTMGSALTVLSLIAVFYSDNGLLTTMILSSVAISVVFILLISWAALTLGEKSTQDISGLMPFALFMMKQRLVSKSTQILGVGLCAFLLLFTLMLLRDLGDTMASYSRQHDGNLLVSQASQQQMDDIRLLAKTHGIAIRQTKPFVYAKVTHVNGQDINEYSETPSDSLATFKRAIRLHWTNTVPANNRIISGEWWQPNEANWQQISIEHEVMTDIGLALGDTLTLYIGEQAIKFTITASHAYKPGSGSITFWAQIPPAALANLSSPRYAMASLELTDEQFALLSELWQQHPTLRMTSLKEITARFDATLAMVTQIISGFSLLIIVLAGIVIVASIQSLETREKRKNSIIMSFGFTRETCLRLNMIEWMVTGTIAATGAIVGTYVAGRLIYQSQFSLSYQPNVMWLLGILSVILCVTTALGIYASKRSLSSSIRDLMAE